LHQPSFVSLFYEKLTTLRAFKRVFLKIKVIYVVSGEMPAVSLPGWIKRCYGNRALRIRRAHALRKQTTHAHIVLK